MSKASVSIYRKTDGGWAVELDGVDIGNALAADGVQVEFQGMQPVVHLTVLPTQLRADLPAAAVDAIEACLGEPDVTLTPQVSKVLSELGASA